MFISSAYAQGAGGGGSGLEAMLPLVLIFVVFYFLLIRPQQKKMKDHKEMLVNIRRGDTVITGGGITGKVTKVDNEHEVTVEIAKDVKVKVQRSLISGVQTKGEPAKGGAANENANQNPAVAFLASCSAWAAVSNGVRSTMTLPPNPPTRRILYLNRKRSKTRWPRTATRTRLAAAAEKLRSNNPK